VPSNPFQTTEATPPQIALILVQVLASVVESVPSWPWLFPPLAQAPPSSVAKEAEADDARSETENSETNPATPSFVHVPMFQFPPFPSCPSIL
jgi:hypothetical protein